MTNNETAIANARRTYRDMLRLSGMDAASFKAACEAHPQFAACHVDADWARYTSAALRVTREIQKGQMAAKRALKIQRIESAVNTCSCERCGGAGVISAYRHISGGVCFECEGTGKQAA